MRAVPAAPALRPVAGAELAGRLARRARKDGMPPHRPLSIFISCARGRPVRAPSWRVGWQGGASLGRTECRQTTDWLLAFCVTP
jgi:hypothetical protein